MGLVCSNVRKADPTQITSWTLSNGVNTESMGSAASCTQPSTMPPSHPHASTRLAVVHAARNPPSFLPISDGTKIAATPLSA